MNLATRCSGRHFFRERWIDRTAINPKRTRTEEIQKSIDAQSCLFDRVRVSQHGEEHVHLSGKFRQRISKFSAGTEQRLCFGASAIEQNQTMALLLQVRRHPTSHDAQTNKSNFHSISFRHAAVTNSGW